MMFDWIVFDIDDTLLDFNVSETVALAKTMKYFNLPDSLDSHKIYKDVNVPLWKALEYGEISVMDIKKRRFGLFAKKLGKDLTNAESEECNSYYLECLSLQAPLLKGAEIVRNLKTRYNLAILTNGLELTQQKRMKQSGLKDCFSFLVTSEKTGVAKPDKRIFDAVWTLMGNPDKQKVLMVGDNTLSDISGGRNFGFKTCWINRKNKTFPYDWQPDYSFENPGELGFLMGST